MRVHARTKIGDREFAIVSSAACMPSSCWGVYRNVALIEIKPGAELPKMISERARNLVEIVDYWGRLRDGTTKRCAVQRAISAATEKLSEIRGAL